MFKSEKVIIVVDLIKEIILTYSLLAIKLFIIFITTIIVIKLIIRLAPKIGLIDVPNHRSSHKTITPRGAGIAIVFGVILSDIIVLNEVIMFHWATFLAILLVFIIGVLDDYRDTSPKSKFIIIFIAVLLLAYEDVVVHSLGSFLGHEIPLGWVAIPFTIFAVAGFTNALNLSDGLDGLAGSLSIIILSTLCVIGYRHDDFFIVSTSLSFITAVVSFMWFNWNPAKIFMGDSGSLTLGFIISILSIKVLDYINPVSILFIAAMPILDTLIVMIRRKRNGLSMFSPDKLHIHHILLNFFNGNVRISVILISLLQLGFSVIGFGFAEVSQKYLLILFLINLSVFYILLNGMLVRQNKFAFYRKRKRKR